MKSRLFIFLTDSLIFFGAIFLNSCAVESSSVQVLKPHPFQSKNYSTLTNALQRADFRCSDFRNCPENVGLIFVNFEGRKSNPRISQCTAFLISEDTVVTNGHCLPDRLKHRNADCSDQIAVRFLPQNGKTSVFSCKQVLNSRQDQSLFGQDYAIIKIEQTPFRPIPLRTSGLKDNEQIKVAKVTPHSDHRAGGRLEVESCKVVIGSALNLRANTSWSQSGVGMGCRTIQGNSGAPVLSQGGEVIGVLQSFATDEYLKELKKQFEHLNLEVPSVAPRHFLFTNLSCIDDPMIASPHLAQCQRDKDLSFTDCIGFWDEARISRHLNFTNTLNEGLPSIFLYRISQKVERSFYTHTASPFCVKPREFLGNFVQRRQSLWGEQEETLSARFTLTTLFEASMSLDADLRFNPEIEFFTTNEAFRTVNITRAQSGWEGSSRTAFEMGMGVRYLESRIQLPECTPDQLESGSIETFETRSGTFTKKEYLQALDELSASEKRLCER